MSEELREQPETAAEAAQAEKEFSEHARVRREKLAALQEAGADPYAITSYDVTAHCAEIRTNFDEMEGKTVRIAGRMMSKRVMGKASFCDVRDGSDRMQVYVKRDDIGSEEYQGFKKGPGRYRRRGRYGIPYTERRNLHPCTQHPAAFQIPSPTS